MIDIQLHSKKDILNLKKDFRSACETQGLRLGQSEKKTEAILASLFKCPNFDTLVGLALKPQSEDQPTEKLPVYHRRINSTGSTGTTKSRIIKEIKEADGVEYVTFAVRPGESNKFALSIVVSTYGGLDRVISVYDDSLLTVERTAREHEILDILRNLKKRGSLDKAVFIERHVPKTDHLPAQEAIGILRDYGAKAIFPNWRAFLSAFTTEYATYEDIFSDSEWKNLAGTAK